MRIHDRQRYLAEGIGTFGLVFAGCGAIMVNELSGGVVTHVGVALTFGLIVMAMISAVGHVSGAHLNPAVTLGFLVARHLPVQRAMGYWAAQFVGALLAAGCLRLLFGNVAYLGATQPSGSALQSFGLEVLLTFFLMFVIIAVATDTRAQGATAAIAIGGTVALEALFAGPISGASMNPARSLGPALLAGVLNDVWIYVTAPSIGAILGAILYTTLREPQPAVEP